MKKISLFLNKVFTFFMTIASAGMLFFYLPAYGQEQCPQYSTQDLTLNDLATSIGAFPILKDESYYGYFETPETVYGLPIAPQLNVRIRGVRHGFKVTIATKSVQESLWIIDQLGLSSDLVREETLFKWGNQIMLPSGIGINLQRHSSPEGLSSYAMALVITNYSYSSFKDDPKPAALIVCALKNKGLFKKRPDQIVHDLNHNSGRHEWAVFNFKNEDNFTTLEWAGVHNIAQSGFHNINRFLRDPESVDRTSSRVMDDLKDIPFIDSAILKNKIDRDIEVYRVVFANRKDIIPVWNKLSENPEIAVDLAADPGFVFTSLDVDIAKAWIAVSRDFFGTLDEAILLKIKLAQGTPAAYIGRNIFPVRGYFEILLGRNLNFIAKRATTDGDLKVLELELQ